jgi:hypothetical protein
VPHPAGSRQQSPGGMPLRAVGKTTPTAVQPVLTWPVGCLSLGAALRSMVQLLTDAQPALLTPALLSCRSWTKRCARGCLSILLPCATAGFPGAGPCPWCGALSPLSNQHFRSVMSRQCHPRLTT